MAFQSSSGAASSSTEPLFLKGSRTCSPAAVRETCVQGYRRSVVSYGPPFSSLSESHSPSSCPYTPCDRARSQPARRCSASSFTPTSPRHTSLPLPLLSSPFSFRDDFSTAALDLSDAAVEECDLHIATSGAARPALLRSSPASAAAPSLSSRSKTEIPCCPSISSSSSPITPYASLPCPHAAVTATTAPSTLSPNFFAGGATFTPSVSAASYTADAAPSSSTIWRRLLKRVCTWSANSCWNSNNPDRQVPGGVLLFLLSLSAASPHFFRHFLAAFQLFLARDPALHYSNFSHSLLLSLLELPAIPAAFVTGACSSRCCCSSSHKTDTTRGKSNRSIYTTRSRSKASPLPSPLFPSTSLAAPLLLCDSLATAHPLLSKADINTRTSGSSSSRSTSNSNSSISTWVHGSDNTACGKSRHDTRESNNEKRTSSFSSCKSYSCNCERENQPIRVFRDIQRRDSSPEENRKRRRVILPGGTPVQLFVGSLVCWVGQMLFSICLTLFSSFAAAAACITLAGAGGGAVVVLQRAALVTLFPQTPAAAIAISVACSATAKALGRIAPAAAATLLNSPLSSSPSSPSSSSSPPQRARRRSDSVKQRDTYSSSREANIKNTAKTPRRKHAKQHQVLQQQKAEEHHIVHQQQQVDQQQIAQQQRQHDVEAATAASVQQESERYVVADYSMVLLGATLLCGLSVVAAYVAARILRRMQKTAGTSLRYIGEEEEAETEKEEEGETFNEEEEQSEATVTDKEELAAAERRMAIRRTGAGYCAAAVLYGEGVIATSTIRERESGRNRQTSPHKRNREESGAAFIQKVLPINPVAGEDVEISMLLSRWKNTNQNIIRTQQQQDDSRAEDPAKQQQQLDGHLQQQEYEIQQQVILQQQQQGEDAAGEQQQQHKSAEELRGKITEKQQQLLVIKSQQVSEVAQAVGLPEQHREHQQQQEQLHQQKEKEKQELKAATAERWGLCNDNSNRDTTLLQVPQRPHILCPPIYGDGPSNSVSSNSNSDNSNDMKKKSVTTCCRNYTTRESEYAPIDGLEKQISSSSRRNDKSVYTDCSSNGRTRETGSTGNVYILPHGDSGKETEEADITVRHERGRETQRQQQGEQQQQQQKQQQQKQQPQQTEQQHRQQQQQQQQQQGREMGTAGDMWHELRRSTSSNRGTNRDNNISWMKSHSLGSSFWLLVLLYALAVATGHCFLSFAASIFHRVYRATLVHAAVFAALITVTTLVVLPAVAYLVDRCGGSLVVVGVGLLLMWLVFCGTIATQRAHEAVETLPGASMKEYGITPFPQRQTSSPPPSSFFSFSFSSSFVPSFSLAADEMKTTAGAAAKEIATAAGVKALPNELAEALPGTATREVAAAAAGASSTAKGGGTRIEETAKRVILPRFATTGPRIPQAGTGKGESMVLFASSPSLPPAEDMHYELPLERRERFEERYIPVSTFAEAFADIMGSRSSFSNSFAGETIFTDAIRLVRSISSKLTSVFPRKRPEILLTSLPPPTTTTPTPVTTTYQDEYTPSSLSESNTITLALSSLLNSKQEGAHISQGDEIKKFQKFSVAAPLAATRVSTSTPSPSRTTRQQYQSGLKSAIADEAEIATVASSLWRCTRRNDSKIAEEANSSTHVSGDMWMNEPVLRSVFKTNKNSKKSSSGSSRGGRSSGDNTKKTKETSIDGSKNNSNRSGTNSNSSSVEERRKRKNRSNETKCCSVGSSRKEVKYQSSRDPKDDLAKGRDLEGDTGISSEGKKSTKRDTQKSFAAINGKGKEEEHRKKTPKRTDRSANTHIRGSPAAPAATEGKDDDEANTTEIPGGRKKAKPGIQKHFAAVTEWKTREEKNLKIIPGRKDKAHKDVKKSFDAGAEKGKEREERYWALLAAVVFGITEAVIPTVLMALVAQPHM